MSRIWDIVEGVFSTSDDITRPQTSKRRPVPEFSSMLQIAVMVSLASAAAVGPTTLISATTANSASSEVKVLVLRSPIPLRRPPAREKGRGADFARGRSAEKLANSFKGYFKPSTNIHDSSDEGFVFD
jgi:hypothetical protein